MDASSSAEMTRRVAEKWFDALMAKDGHTAFTCLDENVHWTDNPGIKDLSDIIPWLGDYHGLEEVRGTFVIRAQVSEVQTCELRHLMVDGDRVMAVVHEIATITPTGMSYDIEFIQHFRVANNKIVEWTCYWDTCKGVVAFRGDMPTRLLTAARTNNVEEAMKVLPFGADPNTLDSSSGQSALLIASSRGHVELVRKLLEFGANPNTIDSRAGTTALHKACQGGHLEVVKALVKAGCFIDQQAPTTGHTPLVEAIWFKSDEIVDYLLRRGARVELNTYYGFTIDDHINYAIRVNKGQKAQESLARIRELVNQRRTSDEQHTRQTLLQSVLAGNLEGVRDSIRKGEDLEQRHPIVGSFSDGHTPLLIAARDGHAEIVSELVKSGADVNATEPVFGAVPLHKATYHGYLEITRVLASATNVDLNYQGPSNGYTPLHDALWHAYAECAQVLMDAGARLDLVAYDGKLPIDIAAAELGEAHEVTRKLRSRMNTANPS